MKTCVIHDLPEFTVTSYGNGLAYCLAHKPSQRDILFQGDDAAQFRAELDGLTEGTPALDYGDALRAIWSDYA